MGVNTIKWYQSLGSYDVLYLYIYRNIYIYILWWCMFCIYWDMPKSKRTFVGKYFICFFEGNASDLM